MLIPPGPRRALKTRGNTPKYGLIFHSTFIGRAAAKNKGRISRYLANKCTIASRIDCFSGALGDTRGGSGGTDTATATSCGHCHLVLPRWAQGGHPGGFGAALL